MINKQYNRIVFNWELLQSKIGHQRVKKYIEHTWFSLKRYIKRFRHKFDTVIETIEYIFQNINLWCGNIGMLLYLPFGVIATAITVDECPLRV